MNIPPLPGGREGACPLAALLMLVQPDRKYASSPRQVAHAQRAPGGFNVLPRNGQPKPQATLVVVATSERIEHDFGGTRRESAAVILDIDEHGPISVRMRAQGDFRVGARELEGILEQVD